MIRLGVDFGGSKIEAAALDADGRFLSRRRRPNPGAYDAAVAAVCALVAEVEADVGPVAAVGVGAPGSVSPRTGVVRNANTVWLNGRAFRDDLEGALARPVKLANDANCLALSEAVDGAGAGAGSVFAVVLGTGCGGGFVRGGRLVEGANGLAGEWGHLPLPWPHANERPGPQCWCGRRGCLETWVAGPGLQRDHRDATGRDQSPGEIVAAARDGDAEARAAMARHASRLGRGLAMLCDVVDPDVFVFGGGLSNISELYEALPDMIRPHVFSEAWQAVLAPARWGDSSGVRGAAWLWDLGDGG